MKRRNFLKGSILAGLAAPTILSSRLFGADSPNEKINVGFISYGDRASQLIGGFLGNPTCRVVGVCDPKAWRVEAFHQKVNSFYGDGKAAKTYANYRELLADKSIDAVVIATPDHNHTPIAIAAARAGKDIYCEKGLSTCMNLRKKLREEVAKNKVVFQYGTQQRSGYTMQRPVELVRNGYIGNVKKVLLCCSGGGLNMTKYVERPVPEGLDYDQWLGVAPLAPYSDVRVSQGGGWFIYDYALGFIAGWGAHPLDIMQWGLNQDSSGPVLVEGGGVIPAGGIFDTLTDWNIRMKYADGVDVHFVADSNKEDLFAEYPHIMERVRGLDYPQVVFIGDEGWIATNRPYFRCSDPRLEKIELKPGDWRAATLDKKSYDHAANFLNCCKSRELTVSHCEAAIRSDTISQLCDVAVRSGKSVHWNPATETTDNITQDKMMVRRQREAWAV